jgi:hypothetical protein
VVAAALGGVLVSLARIESRSVERYDAGSKLSLTLDRMANEVRSGAPAPDGPPGGPSQGVTLIVRRGDGAEAVRWTVEGDALVRSELDGDGAVTERVEMLTGVIAQETFVRHLDPLGRPLSGSWSEVAPCAASVEITVVVSAGDGFDVGSERVMTYRLWSGAAC